MTCILTHQPLNVRLDTSTSRQGLIAPGVPPPKKDAIPKNLLLLNQRFTAHKLQGSGRKSNSTFSLTLLVQEAQNLTKSASSCRTSSSMSKLEGLVPDSDPPFTHIAVFDVQNNVTASAPLKKSRGGMVLKRNGFEESPRRRELLLDNAGSICRRMEEYRRRKIHVFSTDSDSENEDVE